MDGVHNSGLDPRQRVELALKFNEREGILSTHTVASHSRMKARMCARVKVGVRLSYDEWIGWCPIGHVSCSRQHDRYI